MIGKIATAVVIGCTLSIISGCATYKPVEPQDRYSGRIIHKVQIENPSLKQELENAKTEYRASLFLFGLGSVVGGALGGAMMEAGTTNIGGVTVPGQPYRYTIEMEASKKIIIFNKHAGFAIGDCVAVLVGRETKEVSMAYGAECKDGS